MRLAVVGASGLTGLEIARAAALEQRDVVGLVSQEADADRISRVLSVERLRFVDLEHARAVRAALSGVTHVIAALQPRELGPDHPWGTPQAAEALVEACRLAKVEKILWISTMGAWSWSKHVPSKEGWRREVLVRRSKGPWAILKVSAYHDEVLQAHVAPAGDLAPRPLPKKGFWAPVSRREFGSMALTGLDMVPVGRAQCVGGPELFMAAELKERLLPLVRSARCGDLTPHPGLPAGDIAVLPDDTRTTLGYLPEERLLPWLRTQLDGQREADPAEVYPRAEPPPAPLDMGGRPPALETMGPALRRVVHVQLESDLVAQGISAAQLDFRSVEPQGDGVLAHGGVFCALRGVKALDRDGAVLLEGEVHFIRDEMAEEFRVFFGDTLPAHVWRELDMGVRRRLREHPRWRQDPLCIEPASTHPER